MRAHSKTPYSGVCLFSIARCLRPMGLAQNPNQLNQAQPVLSEAAPATTTPPGDPLPPPPLSVCVRRPGICHRAAGFKVAGDALAEPAAAHKAAVSTDEASVRQCRRAVTCNHPAT